MYKGWLYIVQPLDGRQMNILNSHHTVVLSISLTVCCARDITSSIIKHRGYDK